MPTGFNISDVRFVKRIRVGGDAPARSADTRPEAEAEAALALLNRCLSGTPAGRILGIETGAALSKTADGRDALVQWLTYHVGFARKPQWLDGDEVS